MKENNDNKQIKSSRPQLKLLFIAFTVLTSMTAVIHKVALSETDAYFYNRQTDEISIKVTDNVYGSILNQLYLMDLPVYESVYNNVTTGIVFPDNTDNQISLPGSVHNADKYTKNGQTSK